MCLIKKILSRTIPHLMIEKYFPVTDICQAYIVLHNGRHNTNILIKYITVVRIDFLVHYGNIIAIILFLSFIFR